MFQILKDQFCPLCKIAKTENFYQDKTRHYFKCKNCNLIFMAQTQFLSIEEEKARYDQHQNSPYDPKYRQFLNRLFIPMQKRLAKGSFGLDFGSGPGPTLSVMFKEAGYFMENYDYFYAKDDSLLKKQYDFITATEVLEHLHNPKKELDLLWSILKPGGSLGIMTKLALNKEAFALWHYKNDPTHVCFYSQSTFQWIAAKWEAEVTFEDKDVILLKKYH